MSLWKSRSMDVDPQLRPGVYQFRFTIFSSPGVKPTVCRSECFQFKPWGHAPDMIRSDVLKVFFSLASGIISRTLRWIPRVIPRLTMDSIPLSHPRSHKSLQTRLAGHGNRLGFCSSEFIMFLQNLDTHLEKTPSVLVTETRNQGRLRLRHEEKAIPFQSPKANRSRRIAEVTLGAQRPVLRGGDVTLHG